MTDDTLVSPADVIAAPPEMQPSAEERANRLTERFAITFGRGVVTSKTPPAFAIKWLEAAYRDGQSSVLAAVRPLIEAARGALRQIRVHGETNHALEDVLSTFPAAPGRPADKIIEGLREAVSATRLANEILDLLPPEVVTKDLHSRIIAALAPHVRPAPPSTSDRT